MPNQAVSYASRNNCDRQFRSYPKSGDNWPSFELKDKNSLIVKFTLRQIKNLNQTRCEVSDVDVRMGRCPNGLVICASVDNRHRRKEQRVKKLFRYVIATNGILKGQVEFVVAFQNFV